MPSDELLIDGDRRSSPETIAVEDPATGETVGRVAKGDDADARAAIEAALEEHESP